MNVRGDKTLWVAPLAPPTYLEPDAVREISGALTMLLGDVFALYVKTKNFHWHLSDSHLRNRYLLLDEQADQILAITDGLAERVRRVGGSTLCSTTHITRGPRVLDNDAGFVTPSHMLAELRDDNGQLAASMRAARRLCDARGDLVSASLLETWSDEAEGRTWFLFEATRPALTGPRARHH
jgi:starvation-inducible DNA-binding protein